MLLFDHSHCCCRGWRAAHYIDQGTPGVQGCGPTLLHTSTSLVALVILSNDVIVMNSAIIVLPHVMNQVQGEHWTAAMKGHDVDAEAAEADRKRLLLERFQREVRSAACSSALPIPPSVPENRMPELR